MEKPGEKIKNNCSLESRARIIAPDYIKSRDGQTGKSVELWLTSAVRAEERDNTQDGYTPNVLNYLRPYH